MEFARDAYHSCVSGVCICMVWQEVADPRRSGDESSYWMLRSDLPVPREKELRAMITPGTLAVAYRLCHL